MMPVGRVYKIFLCLRSGWNTFYSTFQQAEESGFFPISRRIRLTVNCRCDAAGVSVDQVEDFFCRSLRKKSRNTDKDKSKERPNHFYSKVTN